MKKRVLIWVALALNVIASQAQDKEKEYLREAAGQSVIYHGKAPVQYATSIRRHPYLRDENYVSGDLFYDGVLYKAVNMRLDLFRGELLLLSPDNRFHIVLPPDRFSYATLHGYQLLYIDPDGKEGTLPAGYYLSLYKGSIDLLAYWTCRFNHVVKGMEHMESFEQSVKYYIRKEGDCYPVKGKRSLLVPLKAHKKEIAKYIRREKLNFRRSLEASIIQVVRYYEQLNDCL